MNQQRTSQLSNDILFYISRLSLETCRKMFAIPYIARKYSKNIYLFDIFVVKEEIKYHLNGKLHRLDGPAIEHPNGIKQWYQKDQLHRLDGPAMEDSNGTKKWYQNGQLHRLDGPAIERPDGTKKWYQNDQLHRLDGPAFEDSNGDKLWFQNNELHRLDGPAIEPLDGKKKWYINGIKKTEEEFGSYQLYMETVNKRRRIQ